MAKNLRMTEEMKAEFYKELRDYITKKRAEFEESADKLYKDFSKNLESGKSVDGGFSAKSNISLDFKRSAKELDRKASVSFTPNAWIKMQALIANFKDEVAWNCTAHRGDGKDTYVIDDVFVYPQEVTGVTVDRDNGKYSMWLNSLNDEVFNNLRCQAHSHVDMGVSPSGTDIEHQNEILAQMDEDMFYIFLIGNKKLDMYIKIVDLKENIVFEPKDISYSVKGVRLFELLDEAEELVSKKTYKPAEKSDAEKFDKKAGMYKKIYDFDYLDDNDSFDEEEISDSRWNGYYGYGGRW